MKKSRADRPTIPLSAKKSIPNHQQLFTPYKIDWKCLPLQPVESNVGKNFFQTMKNELSDIKHDFERLIKKETSLKSEREELKPQLNKSVKCQSAVRKTEKPVMPGKMNADSHTDRHGNNQESQIHVLQPRKNSQGEFNYETIARPKAQKLLTRWEREPDQPENKTLNHGPVRHGSMQHPTERKVQQPEGNRVGKEEISSVKDELKQLREKLDKMTDFCKKQTDTIGKASQENSQLQQELNVTCSDSNRLLGELGRSRQEIEHLNQQKQSLLKQLSVIAQLEGQKVDLKLRCDELQFQHHNLSKDNSELISKNSGLQQQMAYLKQSFENSLMKLEREYQLALLPPPKPRLQCSKQFDQWVYPIAEPDSPSPEMSRGVENELNELRSVIGKLEQQLTLEGQINHELREKLKGDEYKVKTEQFDAKKAELVAENYKLKNKITHIEANLTGLEVKNQSLLQEIAVYEEMSKAGTDRKALQADQWETLMDQLEQMRLSNQQLKVQLETEVMRRENAAEECRVDKKEDQDMQKLNGIVKDKMDQVRDLQDKLQASTQLTRRLSEENATLEEALLAAKEELVLESLKQSKESTGEISRLEKSFKGISERVEAKGRELQSVYSFVHRVIIEKTGLADESEAAYLINELKQIIP